VQSQLAGLDPKDPAAWPTVPRVGLFVLTTLAVVLVLWFVWLSSTQQELEAAQAQEASLRRDYKLKLNKAVNLEVLKKQREQVQQYVTQLEKQLPSKAEMDALLSDINQAGLGRSLQFDLFRPGQVAVKEYYAELPISIKVSGRYHDIGAFASDICASVTDRDPEQPGYLDPKPTAPWCWTRPRKRSVTSTAMKSLCSARQLVRRCPRNEVLALSLLDGRRPCVWRGAVTPMMRMCASGWWLRRNQTQPKVQPLPEPKQFVPQPYQNACCC